MILCIAEKPSVAKDIASILGTPIRRDGFYECGNYCVTWTVGHLCSLLEPQDYKPQWKHWALSVLPMLPEKFDIKLIDDAGIRHQFEVIKTLIARADEIVNCGDAGQEGELIQRWVMKLAGTTCPVKRLWISSLTDESIKEGFQNLKPQSDYDRLFQAGLSRALGDWILGMNATRLYTLKYSGHGSVLSIGRVQTPTLALVVKRHFEIANFVPKDSFELHTSYRQTDFTFTGDRFETEKEALKVAEEIQPLIFKITSVSKKKGREAPPRLFDLTSLQVEANKRFGWTADQTLRNIQSLYEKKLTTYPRVDTTYLTDDIYPKVAPTLRNMTPYSSWTAPILAKPIPKTKKVFDNSKVTDHHAIIPTGQSPIGIAGEEKLLYHLVAMRFISAFYPDCTFESTTVLGKAGEYEFKTTGKVIVESGWRVLLPQKSDKGDNSKQNDDEEAELPVFTQDENGPHQPSVAKKTTQPPKYYTEGSLLRAMETAGRGVEDEELREALKDNGIGRPSTRAAIIETLFKRGYIYRDKKNLMASQAGIDLIATINEELLKSAKLTGLWENKLRRIERGEYSAGLFVREISQLIRQIVFNVLSDNTSRRIISQSNLDSVNDKKSKGTTEKKPQSPRITKLEQVKCPICERGYLIKGRTAFGCSRYAEGCSYRLTFEECPPDTKPGVINRKIHK